MNTRCTCLKKLNKKQLIYEYTVSLRVEVPSNDASDHKPLCNRQISYTNQSMFNYINETP